MQTRIVQVHLKSPREAVFNFLADIENLPRWATEFCERVYLERGRWWALTSQGELTVAAEADRATGVIDLYAGPAPDRMGLLPIRVLAEPGGGALVTFTFRQPPELPDELYEQRYRSLLVELRGLIARFGGGTLAAPEAAELAGSAPGRN